MQKALWRLSRDRDSNRIYQVQILMTGISEIGDNADNEIQEVFYSLWDQVRPSVTIAH